MVFYFLLIFFQSSQINPDIKQVKKISLNEQTANKKINTDLINDPETTGKYLHRFSWLEDSEIGAINHEWNWLAGWYEEPKDGKPKAIHYTEGGPWFADYRFCEYHEVWKKYLKDMMNSELI